MAFGDRKEPLRRTTLRRKVPMNSSRQPMPRRTSRPGWKAARNRCMRRAAGLCEARTPACIHHGSQAHHLKLRSQGGRDKLANLAWVCGPCHRFIHDHPRWSMFHGLIRGSNRRKVPPIAGCPAECRLDHVEGEAW